MIKYFLLISTITIVTGLSACYAVPHRVENTLATNVKPSPPFNIGTKEDKVMITSLCEQLNKIRKLPSRDPSDSDPIYEAIIARGEEAIPCLVEKITDESLMPDPREAPPYQNYKVGDTAYFLLLRITQKDDDIAKMLPPKYAKLWATEGVYAYFAYVEKMENRKELQRFWRDWMKENLKK